MRKAIKSLLLILVVSLVILFILLIDLSPAVKTNAGAQVNNAESVQVLLEQVRTSFRQRNQGQKLALTSKQAQSLAGFLQRAVNEAKADVAFSETNMSINISYQLPSPFNSFYINLHTSVIEGKGVNISHFSVGSLPLPGAWVLAAAEYAANSYTQSEVATRAIATVEALDINPNGVDITLTPLSPLLREFKNIKTSGGSEESRMFKLGIAHYLRVLDTVNVPALSSNEKGVSLSHYIHALMQEAHARSVNGSAALENEAAIMALTIYAGSPRFAALVGDLSFSIDRIPVARPKPVLRNRADLSLHFIFSAAIKLLSEKGVSVAVGEFKELMDRGKGGSGYSFVDLSADLSGAHFAALAADPRSASYVQNILMNAPSEDLFMTSIDALEEGMSKAEFETKYSEVDSPAYRRVVRQINQRLERLPITKD